MISQNSISDKNFPNKKNILYEQYQKNITKSLEYLWSKAKITHSKGYDPSLNIESDLAHDLADRIERLLGLPVAERLRFLLSTEDSNDRVALILSEEIVLGKFGYFEKEEALDWGVRIGLAIVTEGVTVAPLQGISSVKIKKNEDGSSYAAVYFAGPIRSAGGTESAFTLAIADKLRTTLGLEKYHCNAWSEDEVGRFTEELRIYEREVGNFQFKVSDEDIRLAINNLPVEINGVETDPVEVIVHRGMKRIETNRVRGGGLRVLNDGIIGRSRKLIKLLNRLAIPGWDWLSELKGDSKSDDKESKSDNSHFSEIISGRPVLSFPGQKGGFRLRYGRSYNTGLSVVAIHPLVSTILNYPVVVGTQVKLDVPGKGAIISFVDTIEPPIVKLKNGTVIKVENLDNISKIKQELESVLYLGDILISYGDFLENNVPLLPSGYTEEWWIQELNDIISNNFSNINQVSNITGLNIDKINNILSNPTKILYSEAFKLSEKLNVPLHPKYLYYWDLITLQDVLYLRNNLKETIDGDKKFLLIYKNNNKLKEIVENLGIPHTFRDIGWIIDGDHYKTLIKILKFRKKLKINEWRDVLEFLTEISGIKIKRKSSAFIGVRVGRPEKAMLRKMKPPVHVLFPLENEGGIKRDILLAAKNENISINIINIKCSKCDLNTISLKCPNCEEETKIIRHCPNCNRIVKGEICPICKISGLPYTKLLYPIKKNLRMAEKSIDTYASAPLKGVQSLINYTKIPEPLEKGILRQKHNLSVYKDGTIRFDVTNTSLTHFKPKQINTSVKKLKKLGYLEDMFGNPLINDDQLLELFTQDIILPIEAKDFLENTANFIDELLTKFYKLDTVYNIKNKDDLVGNLVVGLAPHTSVGIIGRIIGFTNAQVCFAHPYWHSAKRRDCDGDGDSILLLLDVLINFSKDFLPEKIGGWMDAPLLLQPLIIPKELQRQALNFDVSNMYPLTFYEQTLNKESPQKLMNIIDIVKNRLNTDKECNNFSFTHNTNFISIDHPKSAYTTLNSLIEKLEKQIEIATIIRAVDQNEVVKSVLNTHLLRDIIGNMRSYTLQKFRCKSCGSKYRRIPLKGVCLKCGKDLLPSISRGSVEKYIDITSRLLKRYPTDDYTQKRFEVIKSNLQSLFPLRDKEIQTDLTSYY